MSVTRAEVEHVARLAALAVDETTLPALTAQIARIIDYVSQLEAADTEPGGAASSWLSQGPAQPLRPDEVRPADLVRGIAAFTPAVRENLVVVPRLSAMGDG